MKNFLKLILAFSLFTFLVSCGGTDKKEEAKELKVAVFSSGYGEKLWPELVEAYKKHNPDLKVDLLQSKTLEEELTSKIKAGDYPDVIMLAVGRKAGFTENFINEKALADISDVLDRTVPTENVKVSDKIIPGFTNNTVTSPYGDGKTYLMPVLYSPTGLFYNKGLFKEKGWKLPETWDEFFELGEISKKEGISLFTYPVADYLDTFYPAVFGSIGGYDAINKHFSFEKGFYNTPVANTWVEIMGKVFNNVSPETVQNATSNYKKNQQMIIDSKALFMPNGTWVVGEMAETTPDNMQWGMMAYPKYTKDGDRYSFSFFEQIWVPEKAEHKELAKDFIAFLYSDEASKIFAKNQAVQPITSFPYNDLSEDNQIFYQVYQNGGKAIVGGYAPYTPIEGLSLKTEYFKTVDSVVNKTKSLQEWKDNISKVNDTISDNLIK